MDGEHDAIGVLLYRLTKMHRDFNSSEQALLQRVKEKYRFDTAVTKQFQEDERLHDRFFPLRQPERG